MFSALTCLLSHLTSYGRMSLDVGVCIGPRFSVGMFLLCMENRRCSRLLCRGKPRSCLKLPKQISHHNISVANGTVPDKPLFRMSVARTTTNSRYTFALTSGNDDRLFQVRRSNSYKRPSGIVYTAKKLVGPKEYVIDLTLYLLRGRRKTSYISRLYIFVSEYDL